MTMLRKALALALTACLGSTTLALAGSMTPQQQQDARTKVETAIALSNIAMADKDGDAMLVAAKMLAEAGPVAKPGAEMTDGKPTLLNAGEMAKMAKDMGADAAKADAIASSATSAGEQSRDGYWYYSCDSYNNCQWIYAGY